MAFVDFDTLHDDSRVWIYRSSRLLINTEVEKINVWLQQFVQKWTAHNVTLHAHASVHENQFVVILLDEKSSTQASGCSIDSQVRFIKEIGEALHVDFFDRLHFDFHVKGHVQSYHKDDVKALIKDGKLSMQSLVLDHLVKTKTEFTHRWKKPLEESWHARLI